MLIIEKTKKLIIYLLNNLSNVIKAKTKNKLFLKELKDLEFKSDKEYTKSAYSFSFSTPSIRSEILKSIDEKIKGLERQINSLSTRIVTQQNKLNFWKCSLVTKMIAYFC